MQSRLLLGGRVGYAPPRNVCSLRLLLVVSGAPLNFRPNVFQHTHTHKHTHTHTLTDSSVSSHIHTDTHTHTRMLAHTHLHTHIYIYMYTLTQTHIQLHIHIHTHSRTLFTNTHTPTHKHSYLYTHTQIQLLLFSLIISGISHICRERLYFYNWYDLNWVNMNKTSHGGLVFKSRTGMAQKKRGMMNHATGNKNTVHQ